MKRICIVDRIEACFCRGLASEWALMKPHWMKTFLLTAALLGTPSVAKADVVTDWNTIAINAVINTIAGESNNQRRLRDMAMVHAAMFDAMNGIRTEYTPAMVSVHGKGYASREAAGAQAAHDVLVALFPAQQAALGANLKDTLLQIPADPPHGKQPMAEGIAVGHTAAAAVLALRANDHAFDVVPFVAPPETPGNYQLTPGCEAGASVPGFGNVTPFTLADP